jgi:hypothetical protein
LEAVNSPQTIFEHYRELVTPKEAKAWFCIGPYAASRQPQPERLTFITLCAKLRADDLPET